MHEGVSTEDKRMVVDRSNRGGCSSTNVSEDGFASCVCTDAAEVGVMERRLSVLVEARLLCSYTIAVELCRGRRVPSNPETIDIEEAVASCDLMRRGDLVWVV